MCVSLWADSHLISLMQGSCSLILVNGYFVHATSYQCYCSKIVMVVYLQLFIINNFNNILVVLHVQQKILHILVRKRGCSPFVPLQFSCVTCNYTVFYCYQSIRQEP